MKILIDNKSYALQGRYNTFGEIINEVHKKLKNEDKFLDKIIIDGITLNSHSIISTSKVKLLEIFSKSHRGIIFTSLSLLDEYITEYFNALESLELAENDIISFEPKLEEILSFLNWTLNLLYSLKEGSSVDFLYEGFDDFLEEYKDILECLYRVFEEENHNAVLGILEFEVSELLLAFRSNIESYKTDIAIEENLSINFS